VEIQRKKKIVMMFIKIIHDRGSAGLFATKAAGVETAVIRALI